MLDSREITLVDFRNLRFDSPERSLNQTPNQAGKQYFVWMALILACCFLLLITAAPIKETPANESFSSLNLLSIINQDREALGLQPLRINFKLAEAARAKAEHMLDNGYFSHTSPSGIEPWDFIRLVGFKYSYAGENLAINYTNPIELENDLLKSQSHRENLLSPHFTDLGIAIVPGTYKNQPALITVQLFASPADSLALED